MFEDDRKVFSTNVAHDAEELKKYKEISNQFDYRKDTILAEVAKAGLTLEGCAAFSGRGGGLVEHLGTSNAIGVGGRIADRDKYAKVIYDTMIYQRKYAGSMAVAIHGHVDGIILAGGISHDKYLTERLTEMIAFIAPVTVMAVEALAAGALRVLTDQEEAKEYTGIPA